MKELIPVVCNTPDAELFANIQSCVDRGVPILPIYEEHHRVAVLVGGGPSLEETLEDVRQLQKDGAEIWALNGAALYLQAYGIKADYLIIMDAREHNVKFIEGLDRTVKLYLASQCHPSLFDRAQEKRFDIIAWHPAMGGQSGVTEDRPTAVIDGGTSVGIRAFHLMWILGHRSVHLFGYDSNG